MKRGIIILPIVLILLLPICFGSLVSDMDKIESYVDQYNDGDITAPQLVVYLEYMQSKIYETLDKEDQKAFTEYEIESVFDEVPVFDGFGNMMTDTAVVSSTLMSEPMPMKEDMKSKGDIMNTRAFGGAGKQYEKVFTTDNFDVVFTANQIFRHDKEYYESKDFEADSFYNLGYYLRPVQIKPDTSGLKGEIEDFAVDMKIGVNAIESKYDYNALKKQLGIIKQKLQNSKDCDEILGDVLTGTYEADYTTDENGNGPNMHLKEKNVYYLKIKENTKENCWQDNKCEWTCEDVDNTYNKCEPKEICNENCWQDCHPKETCLKTCTDSIQETTDETTGVTTNETVQTCTEECSTENICDEKCEPNCHWQDECNMVTETKENCYDKCEPVEKCEDQLEGEVRIEGRCDPMFGDIYINAYGPGLDWFNEINNVEWKDDSCKNQLKGLVKIREALQDDVNNNFAVWFHEDFISNDPEKVANGERGFRRVIDLLTENENEIANNMHCNDNAGWPAGFSRISVEYHTDNANVEVWEKLIPMGKGGNLKYWTTLYKYAWLPDKELTKRFINYQMTEKKTFGPTAKDVAKIKADEGKMEIVTRLANKYGGSFDVKLLLEDESGAVVQKYLKINPDVAVKIDDTPPTERPDISITVDFDVLYNFIRYMNFEMDGSDIKGPYWVNVDKDEGLGNVISVLGAVSKMWREGVKIRPRYALFKMFFNTKKMVELMQESDDNADYADEEFAVTTEVDFSKEG